jgi:predicted phosphodiesterase
MARYAIISDIHGNLQALEAVLQEIESLRISEVVCLGDIVGYGPNPRECLDLVMTACRQTIRGNHDDAAVNPATAESFNGSARTAIMWTRSVLFRRHLDMLRLLPHVAYVDDRALCVHDCPVPGPTDYVHDVRMAAMAFRGFETQVCLLGHTHVPTAFEVASQHPEDVIMAKDVAAFPLRDGQGVRFASRKRYICNPGSVGQPRDADPRASFGVLDLRRNTFSVHRVAYDVASAQLATSNAGLPTILAERLAVGA